MLPVFRAALPWIFSGFLGTCLVSGAGWFFFNYPWVPFYPICLAEYENSEVSIKNIIAKPLRVLDGKLRPEFRYLVTDREEFQNYRATEDGIFITIEYILDINLYWNFTRRMLGSLLDKELNPIYYDSYGEFRDEKLDVLEKEFPVVNIGDFWTYDCATIRFFMIEGTRPSKYILNERFHRQPDPGQVRDKRLFRQLINQYQVRERL